MRSGEIQLRTTLGTIINMIVFYAASRGGWWTRIQTGGKRCEIAFCRQWLKG